MDKVFFLNNVSSSTYLNAYDYANIDYKDCCGEKGRITWFLKENGLLAVVNDPQSKIQNELLLKLDWYCQIFESNKIIILYDILHSSTILLLKIKQLFNVITYKAL